MAETKIRNEQITSEAVISGYVLTADGAGIADWKAGGGGGALVVEEQDEDPSVANVTKIKVSNGSLTDDGGGVVSLVTSSGSGGSGNVATDAIWDAKGDIAGGTGDDAADNLTVGANYTVLNADSGEATGLKWQAPLPLLETAYASAADAHTSDNTWEDINSMSVTLTAPVSCKIYCTFTCKVAAVSANWEHINLRFDLDGITQSEIYGISKSANPTSSPIFVITIHTVFSGVSVASHTIKAQWHDNTSSLNATFSERRLTAMLAQ